LELEHDDPEGEKHYEQKKDEKDTGENNIGKDPFHDVIQEGVQHIAVNLRPDFFPAHILEKLIEYTCSGLLCRHPIYDRKNNSLRIAAGINLVGHGK
jgi:hypothetical protein